MNAIPNNLLKTVYQLKKGVPLSGVTEKTGDVFEYQHYQKRKNEAVENDYLIEVNPGEYAAMTETDFLKSFTLLPEKV